MIFSRDTSPDAARMLIEILRKKAPAEKLEMVDAAFATGRALTMAGLRMRHPGAGPEELHARYLELMLGRDLARQVLAAAHASPRSSATASG